MLNKLANLSEKITVRDPMIDQWLSSRRQLLVTYYQFVGLTPNHATTEKCDKVALEDFCQRLVDYLSSGHFKHFQQVEALLANESQQELICTLYPSLEESTHQLLSLCDKFIESALNQADKVQSRQVISKLGMLLESRFDLEDKLLLSTQVAPPAQLKQVAPLENVVADQHTPPLSLSS